MGRIIRSWSGLCCVWCAPAGAERVAPTVRVYEGQAASWAVLGASLDPLQGAGRSAVMERELCWPGSRNGARAFCSSRRATTSSQNRGKIDAGLMAVCGVKRRGGHENGQGLGSWPCCLQRRMPSALDTSSRLAFEVPHQPSIDTSVTAVGVRVAVADGLCVLQRQSVPSSFG